MKTIVGLIGAAFLVSDVEGQHYGHKYNSQYDPRIFNKFDGYYNTVSGIPDYSSYKTGTVNRVRRYTGTHPIWNQKPQYASYGNSHSLGHGHYGCQDHVTAQNPAYNYQQKNP